MLRSDLCDFSDAYIVVKEKITVTNKKKKKNDAHDKKLVFEIMHHLFLAFQKLIIHSLKTQMI